MPKGEGKKEPATVSLNYLDDGSIVMARIVVKDDNGERVAPFAAINTGVKEHMPDFYTRWVHLVQDIYDEETKAGAAGLVRHVITVQGTSTIQ